MSPVNVSARQTKRSDPLKDIEDNYVTDDEDCDDAEHLSALMIIVVKIVIMLLSY